MPASNFPQFRSRLPVTLGLATVLKPRLRTSALIKLILAAIVVVEAIGGTAARAADPACAPVFDALVKSRQTPSHQFQETKRGGPNGKSQSSEVVNTATAMYLRVNGKWMKSRSTPQQMAEMERDNVAKRSANSKCQHVRDETLEGEPAALYSARESDEDSTSTSQIWISKRSGLPLRQITDMSVGGGEAGNSRITITFVYANVQAPAGVQ